MEITTLTFFGRVSFVDYVPVKNAREEYLETAISKIHHGCKASFTTKDTYNL
jgi:phosphoribosylaminoimidazole (AIR) synthetase